MRKYAIIVAGGTGQRFGTHIPKQFLHLKGEPMLLHTLRAFYHYNQNIQLIVTLPPQYIELWEKICEEHAITIPHKKIAGGETRFYSVKNGLDTIEEEEGLVAIHDAVRPLVSQETLQRCFEIAKVHGNAIPVINIVETIRRLDLDNSQQVDREEYVLVQTPQVFDIKKIKKAYHLPYSPEFTDDASVYEKMGHKIILVEGNRENIKITTQSDLLIAEALINNLNNTQ